MMMLDHLAVVGAAVSSTTRLAILLHLADHQRAAVGQVAAALGLTSATVVRHVRVLEAAGLVERRRAGRRTLLTARIDRLRVVRDAATACMTRGLAREVAGMS